MSGFTVKNPDRHRRRVPGRRPDGPDPHPHPGGHPERPGRRRRGPGSPPRPSAAATSPAPNGPSSDPLEAINDPAVEAVVIVTPTSTHASLIEAALRAGKADLEREADRARPGRDEPGRRRSGARRGLPVQLGFMRRFDPGYVRAKELIDARRARARSSSSGPTRGTRTCRRLEFLRDSGGSFLDMSVHDFDLARFLVGEVEEVSAWGGVLVDERFDEARRRRHGGDHAPLPQRRPGRRRDVAPLGVGLRHPDRGRRRAGQGRRRGAPQDAGDLLAAVRLRGRPLRELPGPVRGRLPARARGVLPDAGRGRNADARARRTPSRRSGSPWPRSGAGAKGRPIRVADVTTEVPA